ncbi:hypothetical protein NECAME_02369 [Necator americanus]|uniref:Uncharacterized protein n=1 Tax=Necator americanus TaxID=51031 RepID=W2THF7_NECAM|nr:hypothetical protein NECAME_02369 [Necator americanus]ETN80621.1 hypothetical protein NECAME_02369 [Necator americanus]
MDRKSIYRSPLTFAYSVTPIQHSATIRIIIIESVIVRIPAITVCTERIEQAVSVHTIQYFFTSLPTFLIHLIDSAGTLLSDSSASEESTPSIDPLERVTSAASAPILRNSNSAMSISYSSAAAAVRPRRRVAPMISPLKLPITHGMPLPAPLATPEMVDIAPEYSVVQDALVDDEHIYATLDFSSKPVQKIPDKGEKKPNAKKEKKVISKKKYAVQ